jgi:hypothetical protein
MVKRIAALIFIFICTTLAWAILGATIFSRTYSSDDKLQSRVVSTWGTRQAQVSPTAHYTVERVEDEVRVEDGKTVMRKVTKQTSVPVPLQASRVNVAFRLDPRQKGLLWYSTYAVDFSSEYTFANPTEAEQPITFSMKFPAAQAIYDDLQVLVDGQAVKTSTGSDAITATVRIPAGKPAVLTFGYCSQGMENWQYKFGDEVSQVKDFALTMKTNFSGIDFPQDTLSPTEKHEIPGGWQLDWRYKNLLTGLSIGMTMPEKLQPGPLAGQISFFAPVSLFFFFFLMFIITTLREIELHPMNYFFLATAFFAFHLLLAYLVDHISIHWAFVICSVVSVFLVVSYLRLVVGIRFAAVEAAGAQFIYLILFSYAFFFKGFTGLAITIGSIVTLFVVMQMTGRIKWAEKFAATPWLRPKQ